MHLPSATVLGRYGRSLQYEWEGLDYFQCLGIRTFTLSIDAIYLNLHVQSSKTFNNFQQACVRSALIMGN